MSDIPEATCDGFEIRDNEGRLTLYRTDGDTERMVSGAVWVHGQARDISSARWCHVVDYIDQDDKPGQWLMPRTHLANDNNELLRNMYDRGLFIVSSKKARDDLADYLSRSKGERYTVVDCTGWHGDSFVLPSETIGEGKYLLSKKPEVKESQGSLESWQENVSRYCKGNSRLILSASTAFASPLLLLSGVDMGGVGLHLVGESSQGKTTALKVANSVHGAGVQSWRATDNGLEGIAAIHSDKGLLLDDMGQVDANVAGAVAYMLGNGQGKGRSKRDGSATPIQTWRLFFLSTGEVTLSEHSASVGKKTKAGQEVRILNVEADAGMGFGLFENLHCMSDGKAFADCLDEGARRHTGHAGQHFIEHVVENRITCTMAIKEFRSAFEKNANVSSLDNGQVRRVASHFALIAAAGELATEAGITGWETGDAISAATTCFDSWRKSWSPSGAHEATQSIDQVRSFLQQNAARFDSICDDNRVAINRAGFVSSSEYWVFPNVFTNEVCLGLRTSTVKKALTSKGYLLTDDDGKLSARRRAEGKRQRFYVISDAILGGAEDE